MGVAKRKRKTKPWQAVVWVSGVRVAIESFETKAEACLWHDKTKRSFESGLGPIREMTLAEVMDRYCETEFASKTNATRRRRNMRFEFLHESPTAQVMMRDFDGSTVDFFIKWLIGHERAQTVTRKSFVEEVKTLRLVLGYYRDYLDAQFVVPVTKRHLKAALFKGPIARKSKEFYLPVEHALRWFEAFKRQKNPVYRDMAMVQVITGMRIGEVSALCDDAVDFERKVVTIKRTMEWVNADGTHARRIEDRTKTAESRRVLPFPPEVEAIFKRAMARPTAVLHKSDSGKLVRVLFHSTSGEPMCHGSILRSYSLAFKAAGLPWSGTHICRDTNGSLGMKDSSLEAMRVNLGHASVVETEGYARIHAMTKNTVPENVARQLFRSE